MRRLFHAGARAFGGLLVVAATATASGCLRRDVSTEQPTTKIFFETQLPQPAIDKVDVLVMVDNSSSMADKQKILANAVPDLLRGLVQPKCVDKKTYVPTGALADPQKPDGEQCPPGTKPAFNPITDMHVGVISSSMGGFGGDQCKPDEPGRHNDDHGHLLARGASGDVPEAGDLHFLAWYPDVQVNRDKTRHPEPPVPKLQTLDAFGDAFRRLVVGVGQDGCGLEAQLESVYHFLVQPDPWTTIRVDGTHADYGPPDAIDGELLRQRAAFLRPDSLVAILVLSDEDDSSADPLSLGGQGFVFESLAPLPRATSVCDATPAAPACTTCAGAADCDPKDPVCAARRADPSCAIDQGVYTDVEDPLNVRFQHMKKRFGVDPQFPVARYVDAFTKPKVPRRASEHDRGAYAPKADCTNPLFASRLPSEAGAELCALPRGTRPKELVYFAVIGGVPNQLIGGAGVASGIDWAPVLGRDPATLDETGIDPHMKASTDKRDGLPPPEAADDADPISGREWTTGGTDLQYACIFDLYDKNPDGSVVPIQRKCDSADKSACDCDGKKDTPLCAPRGSDVQVKGKAYPTRRELMVAKELGDHAIVASLCPRQLTAPDADDYGYRPAVNAIADALADQIHGACVPRALERDGDGAVPCLVMALLPDPGPDSDCQTRYGLANPPPDVLARFRDRLAAEEGEAARALPVCLVPEIQAPDGPSCLDDESAMGFCYVDRDPVSKCSYELLFTKATQRIAGARFQMQCIQVSSE